MGGGAERAAAAGTSCSRQLEQLRWLVHRDFDPPLHTAELTQALAASGDSIQLAYHYLKERRRRAEGDRARATSMSQPATSMSQPVTTAPAVAKRRLGLLDEREASDAPAKKPKSEHEGAASARVAASQPTQSADGAADDDMGASQPPGTAPLDFGEARRVLQTTVSVRARGEQRGDPDWATAVMRALQVQPLLEVVMPLNLAADALAVWAKTETEQQAAGRQRKALEEVVAAVALVQRQEADADGARPIEEVAAKHEEEIATLRREAPDPQQALLTRGMAAQRLVEAVSAAFKTHFDRLQQLSESSDKGGADPHVDCTDALDEKERAAARRVDESAAEVQEADVALQSAKGVMEARAKVLVNFINQRVKALMDAGESEDGATWKAAVEITRSNDDEIAAFRASREESEQRAASCQDVLQKRSSKLAFDKSLLALVRAIKTERTRHDEALRYRFEHAQDEIQQRTAEFVERHLGTLVGALQVYFEFRSVQDSSARRDEEAQGEALKDLVGVYGDSAPIKKRDIEQRIAEFKNIRALSAEGIADMVKAQQGLWTPSIGLLSAGTRQLVVHAFRDLYRQLDAVVQDAMLALVTSLDVEKTAAPSEKHDSPPCSAPHDRPPTEELFRGAYGPEDAVVGSYRTAISPVLATDDASLAATKPGLASPPARAAPIVNTASVAVPVKMERPHEFALGTVVFTKFNIAENCSQFFRGKIVELLPDGGYRVQYDDSDVFSVERQYLFTQEQVAHEMPHETTSAAADAPGDADGSGCVVM